MKAKFVGKTYGTGHDRDMVYLEYEYRGYRYELYENLTKGNEPLAWQHKMEQSKIDSIIDSMSEKKDISYIEPAEAGLDRLFRYFDGDETAFD